MRQNISIVLAGALATAGLALAAPSHAQNTSGVFSPSVRADDRSAQYRGAFTPGEDGGDARHAHRVHYQHALNDSLRWRVLAQFRDPGEGDVEYQYAQGELLWQVRERGDGVWASALRFDLRLTEGGDSPDFLRVSTTNQFDVSDTWHVRALLLATRDISDDPRDGVALETRFSLTADIGGGRRFGAETFNRLGRSDDIQPFDEQRHTVGPVLSGRLAPQWGYQVGALFGVTDTARDQDYRFWLVRRF